MLKRRVFGSIPAKLRWGSIASWVLLSLVVTLSLVACASPAPASAPAPTPTGNPKPSGPIVQKWIEPHVYSDNVSVSVSDVDNNWNTRFRVQTASGEITAMVYLLDGKIYARANVCPPCRSVGFSLVGDILDCNSCGTKFKATTGQGVSGACVNYPKASVPYIITDGKVVMSQADLLLAYQNTLSPGQP